MLQTLSMDEHEQIPQWVTISTKQEQWTCMAVVENTCILLRNKKQIASLLFTELSTIQIKFMNCANSDPIHDCAISVYGSSDCCSSIRYLIVWGHWPNYLHANPTCSTLPRVHQQWRNENPSTYHQANQMWRSNSIVYMQNAVLRARGRCMVRRWSCASNAGSGLMIFVWWKQSQNSTEFQGIEPIKCYCTHCERKLHQKYS